MKNLMITLDHVVSLVWNHTLEGNLDGLNNYFTCATRATGVTPTISTSIPSFLCFSDKSSYSASKSEVYSLESGVNEINEDVLVIISEMLKKLYSTYEVDSFSGNSGGYYDFMAVGEFSVAKSLTDNFAYQVRKEAPSTESIIEVHSLSESDMAFLDDRKVPSISVKAHDNSRSSAENYSRKSKEYAGKQTYPIIIGVGSSGLKNLSLFSEISRPTEITPNIVVEDAKSGFKLAMFGQFESGKTSFINSLFFIPKDTVSSVEVENELHIGREYLRKRLQYWAVLLKREVLRDEISNLIGLATKVTRDYSDLIPRLIIRDNLTDFESKLLKRLQHVTSGIYQEESDIRKHYDMIFRCSFLIDRAAIELQNRINLWLKKITSTYSKVLSENANLNQRIEEKLAHLINGFSIRMNTGNLIPSHEGSSSYRLSYE